MLLLLPLAGAHAGADVEDDDEGRRCMPKAAGAAAAGAAGPVPRCRAPCPRAALAGGSAAGKASRASDRGVEARRAPANAERMALAVCTRQ